MRNAIAILAAATLLSATVTGYRPAAAAAPQAGYAGWTRSSVTGCPNIMWRLARHDDGTVTGIVYYADMSGVSNATGRAAGGTFEFTLAPSMGNGPAGSVSGTRTSAGRVRARLTGTGCANATFDSKPIQDLNTFSGGTG
jgi:hypothetical protein